MRGQRAASAFAQQWEGVNDGRTEVYEKRTSSSSALRSGDGRIDASRARRRAGSAIEQLERGNDIIVAARRARPRQLGTHGQGGFVPPLLETCHQPRSRQGHRRMGLLQHAMQAAVHGVEAWPTARIPAVGVPPS